MRIDPYVLQTKVLIARIKSLEVYGKVIYKIEKERSTRVESGKNILIIRFKDRR